MHSQFKHPSTFQSASPLIRCDSNINLPRRLRSGAHTSVSCFYQTAPHFHRPQCSGQKTWGAGSRAIDPRRWEFTRGQPYQGSRVKAEWVKWDWMCPPHCQEPMKVSVAQFIPWPRLVNSASRPSTELWFVINVFHSQPVHIIPLQIEEWGYRPYIDFGWRSSWPAGRGFAKVWSLSIVNNAVYTPSN